MVDAHIVRCAECRAFESGALTVTDLLRAAPLEPLERPVVVRPPARTWVARAQIGMAAALALVFFGVASQLAQRPSDSGFGEPERYPTSMQLEREVKQIFVAGRTFSQHSGNVIPI